MKRKIIVASPGGQGLEQVVRKHLGEETFFIPGGTFDQDPEYFARFNSYMMEQKPRAVVIDYWHASISPFFSKTGFEIADQMTQRRIQTFFVAGDGFDAYARRSTACSLWHTNTKLTSESGSVRGLHRIVDRIPGAYFETVSGKPFVPRPSDSGQEALSEGLRDWTLFRERDWPTIFKSIDEIVKKKEVVA